MSNITRSFFIPATVVATAVKITDALQDGHQGMFRSFFKDAAPTSNHASLVMRRLVRYGFERIGWNQEQTFIHCDIDAGKPQRVLFSYD